MWLMIGCHSFDFSNWETKPMDLKERINHPRSFYLYFNSDLSRKVYKVDSIKFDPEKFIILKSPINKHAFITSKDVWDDDSFAEKKLLHKELTYILAYKMHDMTWSIYFEYLEYPSLDLDGDAYYADCLLKPDSVSFVKDTYRSYHFVLPPSYYYLLLVRGDTYNKMCHSWMDNVRFSWLNFPNKNAYYKIVVPIWEDKAKLKEVYNEQLR